MEKEPKNQTLRKLSMQMTRKILQTGLMKVKSYLNKTQNHNFTSIGRTLNTPLKQKETSIKKVLMRLKNTARPS